jgi:hypothetical protein
MIYNGNYDRAVEFMSTPENDAIRSVAREGDSHIIDPAYTRSALEQMGMQRSYGETKAYRARFTKTFVECWIARYELLTGQVVL